MGQTTSTRSFCPVPMETGTEAGGWKILGALSPAPSPQPRAPSVFWFLRDALAQTGALPRTPARSLAGPRGPAPLPRAPRAAAARGTRLAGALCAPRTVDTAPYEN